MKIAILSDVHGNFFALEKVYSKCKEHSPDEIVFLGDLCTLGPNPLQTAEFLLEQTIKPILGNHDEYMFHEEAIYSYTKEPLVVESILWAKNELSTSILNRIQKFPPTLSLQYDNSKSILFFHGSPKCNTDQILSETLNETLSIYLQGLSESILIGGHTHIQMQRRYLKKTLINPGSVGQPFQANSKGGPPVILPWAEFCILTFERDTLRIEFFQVEYDIKKYVSIIKDSKLPLKSWLASQYNGLL